MKKYLSLISLLVLSLVSCTNEIENIFTGGEVTIINVSADEFQTETRTSIDNTNYSVKWSDGDMIGIFPMKEKSTQIAFRIENGTGTNNASFDGNGWGLKSDVSYAAYYPAQNNIELSKESIMLDYNGQTQNGNKNTNHLGKYDFMLAPASTPTNGSVSFNFSHIGTLLHFHFTIPEAAELTSIILKTNGELAEKATLNLTTNQVTATATNVKQTLLLENVSVAANGVLDAYMMIAAVNLTGKTLAATVTSAAGDAYVADLTAQDFVGGDVWNYSRALTKDAGNTYLGHAYVDLGIIDGNGNKVLWATTNVGADYPWEYGGYYAWGETKAYNEEDTSNAHNYVYGNTYKKTYYDWSTYKWATGSNEYSISKYSRADNWTIGSWYEGSSYVGLDGVKNQRVLEPVDDAAVSNWGNGWRMPTHSELDLLLGNCYWNWVTEYNGHTVSGFVVYKAKTDADKRKFVAPKEVYSLTDAHIFLPASGCRYHGDLDDSSNDGNYWSSDLGNDSYSAHYLYFRSNYVNTYNCNYRYYGRNVRPVYVKQN